MNLGSGTASPTICLSKGLKAVFQNKVIKGKGRERRGSSLRPLLTVSFTRSRSKKIRGERKESGTVTRGTQRRKL